jgi:S-adenosylmethionine:tRNA ribosyltransferase-isomerase
MLVARRSTASLTYARVQDLPEFLVAGDILVVNTSATLPAALPARLGDRPVTLHLSTQLDDGTWVVELRGDDLEPFGRPPIGAHLELPERASADLIAAYLNSKRLAIARLSVEGPVEVHVQKHGAPIRYPHAQTRHPLGSYQTIFAREPGSAEMPSAARPFTHELVTELVTRGVLLAPVTLHAGVSSLERGEQPYPERFRVPWTTAQLLNARFEWGGRVIAVGTTVVRAIESAATPNGLVAPADGWTDLVITRYRPMRAIDGLLSGWHDPASSHIELLEAATGAELLERSYAAARARGFEFHEFGDAHLILP